MAALAIIGIMNTFIRRLAHGAPLSMEDGIEQVTDTVMYGLLVRAPSETERQRTMAGTA
jgi:hypothetical protein